VFSDTALQTTSIEIIIIIERQAEKNAAAMQF